MKIIWKPAPLLAAILEFLQHVLWTLLGCVVLCLALGAGYRTQNFVVDAPTPELAKRVGDEAERLRSELFTYWHGQDMPPWSHPCLLTAEIREGVGTGGATSFSFDRGHVGGWRSRIQGSEQGVFENGLPHEITHMVIACYARATLPRWLDEGIAVSMESGREQNKHHSHLIEFLKTGRGIPFSDMFAMTEYPVDAVPLYAQGHSLVRYLMTRGGRDTLLAFLKAGVASEDWPQAIRDHYGYENLAALQDDWLAWVKQGCPGIGAQQIAARAAIPSDGPPTAVYRVNQRERGGRYSDHGSAVAISDRLLLTNAHIFRDYPDGQTTISGATGPEFPARVLAKDFGPDLALVAIDATLPTWSPIADHSPGPGEMVYVVGFKSGKQAGTVLNRGRWKRESGHPLIEVRGEITDGDSGGGVYNTAGELVGILWGSDGVVNVIPIEVIRDWSDRINPQHYVAYSGGPAQPQASGSYGSTPQRRGLFGGRLRGSDGSWIGKGIRIGYDANVGISIGPAATPGPRQSVAPPADQRAGFSSSGGIGGGGNYGAQRQAATPPDGARPPLMMDPDGQPFTGLVVFGAHWCKPCQEMKPDLDALVKDGWNILPICVDHNTGLASHYKIESVPCLVVMKGGAEITRYYGKLTGQQLSDWMTSLGIAPDPERQERMRNLYAGEPKGLPVGSTLIAGPVVGEPMTQDQIYALSSAIEKAESDKRRPCTCHGNCNCCDACPGKQVAPGEGPAPLRALPRRADADPQPTPDELPGSVLVTLKDGTTVMVRGGKVEKDSGWWPFSR